MRIPLIMGAGRDTVFVERLWRSVKYEEVYLKAYDSVAEARASSGRYLEFYNRKRPHSSLGARTPDQANFDRQPQGPGGMSLSPPGLERHSSRARPSLRDAPTPAKHNRQRSHLASGDSCPDSPGHRKRQHLGQIGRASGRQAGFSIPLQR